MEKEFLPYKESLELRKLGFDEPCLGYYKDGRMSGVSKWDRKDWEFHVLTNKEITNLTSEIILAPLYQQAFRWFREKHGLYHYITTHDSTDFEWYVYDKDQNDWEDDTTQNTPEEAELACLGKLINIVKDGN
jgi:hypothetical protein